MGKNWQQWSLIGIVFLGMVFGSKMLWFYEEKVPVPAIKKSIALEKKRLAEKKAKKEEINSRRKEIANKLIHAGLQRIGVPYVYGGTSDRGFDCSGFVHHIFSEFNVKVPRSSVLMADAGKPVKATQARRGDILIFTGTNPSVRTPGHVGIVISKPGEPLKFVHASSNGGVKISQVPGTNYERRFLEVRRVL